MVERTCLQLGTISINGGQAGSEDRRDTDIVADTQPDKSQNAQFGGKTLVAFRNYLCVFAQQQVHFCNEIRKYIQESCIEIDIVFVRGNLCKRIVFQFRIEFFHTLFACQTVVNLPLGFGLVY